MGKVTKAVKHLIEEEIEERIKNTVGFWRVKRWMVIRHVLVNPSSAKEIALNTGMAEQSVHNLIAAYNREGEKVVEAKGKGQSQKANLTIEEEKEFLKPFFEKAEKGQITTASEIKKSLYERAFKKVKTDRFTFSTIPLRTYQFQTFCHFTSLIATWYKLSTFNYHNNSKSLHFETIEKLV